MSIDFSNINILVVGDVMLDEYIVGERYRISDEAPVPILTVDEFLVYLGGAANVANNITSLGGRAFLCGVVGGGDRFDSGGIRHGYSYTRFMNLMEKCGLSTGLIIPTNNITTTKSRIIINGQQVVRYDYEKIHDESISEQIINKLTTVDFEKIDLVIISDYAKGVISEPVMDFLRSCHNRIIVDPKPQNINMYKNALCLTPNRIEYDQMCRNINIANSDMSAACFEIINKYKLSYMIVKMGKFGIFYRDEHQAESVPCFAKEVVNTIGAGDTFVAAFCLSLCAGVSIIESIKFANMASSIVISKQFTSVCYLDEIKDFEVLHPQGVGIPSSQRKLKCSTIEHSRG